MKYYRITTGETVERKLVYFCDVWPNVEPEPGTRRWFEEAEYDLQIQEMIDWCATHVRKRDFRHGLYSHWRDGGYYAFYFRHSAEQFAFKIRFG